jgi:dipeptidyl aminopeptidase/acylaminoacyl peptidase
MPFDPDSATVTEEPMTLAENVGILSGSYRGMVAASESGLIAHRALASDLRQLTWMDRTGKILGTIGPPDRSIPASPDLSIDGQRVALGRIGNGDVWTIDIARDVISPITSDPGIDNSPLWTVDGRVVFTSNRYGVFEVLRSSLAGPEERIVSLKESVVAQSLSADGKTLVYAQQSSKTGSDIWAKPMTAGGEPFLVVQTPADDFNAKLSPDGGWIAYESTTASRSEVWVQRFPRSGERWQVSRNGGSQPRWHPDGRELFYLASDGYLTAVSLSPSAQNPGLGVAVPLFQPDMATHLPSPAFRRPQYDISKDGRFLINRVLEPPSTPPIQLLINWTRLLNP